MAIVENNETWRGESGSDVANGERTLTRKFQIVCDDPNESFSTIRAALPTGAHPDDASAYVSARSWSRSEDSRLVWDAEITYEFKLEDPAEPPLDRDPKIRWSSSLIVRPVVRDINGNAITNSAGDFFDPPPEAEIPRGTATIQFNAAAVPVGIMSYMGAVNNAAVTIDGESFAAERVRVIGLDIGEEDEENDEAFRSVTVVVECRDSTDEGFDLNELDQGFRIRDTVRKTGTLTTRTSDSVGSLTMASGHGITTGQGIDLYWDDGDGARIGIVAGTVAGDVVPISGGAGYVLPTAATAVFILTGGLKDILIEDEDGNQARPSAPVLLDGIGGKLVDANLNTAKFRPFVVTRKLDLTVFPGIT